MQKLILFLLLALLLVSSRHPSSDDFQALLTDFAAGYQALDVPGLVFDYREYFGQVRPAADLARQADFFAGQARRLAAIDRTTLSAEDQLYYDHLAWEIALHTERIRLEQAWDAEGRPMASGGLHDLPRGRAWYAYFVKRFTSMTISPEEVHELGRQEVARVQREVAAIQREVGLPDSAAFYRHLRDEAFYLTDKAAILAEYARIDSTVRAHLPAFLPTAPDLPKLGVMEWPDAGPNTPPGIYRPRSGNAYGSDVFQFNFYGQRHNRRAMDWLYLHEGIPGHHLQSTIRAGLPEGPEFQTLFYYPGNFEGWAGYVEYFGEELGLYTDPYRRLGKWEWDLVRSARLVIETGIHYYGWTREQAFDYWRRNLPGQYDIAEREITRVTNWPGQALCYKTGAYVLEQLAVEAEDQQALRAAFLRLSRFPMEVVRSALSAGDLSGQPKK